MIFTAAVLITFLCQTIEPGFELTALFSKNQPFSSFQLPLK